MTRFLKAANSLHTSLRLLVLSGRLEEPHSLSINPTYRITQELQIRDA